MAPVFMPGRGRTRVYPNLCVPVGMVGLGSWLPGPVSYVSLLPFEQRVTVVSIFYLILFSK